MRYLVISQILVNCSFHIDSPLLACSQQTAYYFVLQFKSRLKYLSVGLIGTLGTIRSVRSSLLENQRRRREKFNFRTVEFHPP